MDVYLVTVVAYLLILIGISVWLGFRVKTQEDFMVAGRTLTWPVLVGTLLATWIGSGSIFGGGTLGYQQGFAALWQPAGAWLGIVIIYFVAGRARRFGQFTVPDIMEERYGAMARVLATIATVVSYVIIGWHEIRGALPPSHFSLLGTMTVKEALALFLPTLFLLLGNANMYQRFFAARDEREARRSVVGWVAGVIIVESLVITLAVVGSSMPRFRGLTLPETIIPEVARNGLPTAIGCLLLAAIVAIIVSTADSFLLVPATNLVRDIYQRFINPQATHQQILIYSRLAVFALGALSYGISVTTFKGILQAVLAAYSIYGAAVTPALLAVYFWPRATSAGGTASILVGTVVWLIWELWRALFLDGEQFPLGVETIYSALAASTLALVLVSLATPPEPERGRRFAA